MITSENNYAPAVWMLAATLVVMQSCTDGKSETKSIPRSSEPVPVEVIALEKTTTTSIINASGQITTDDETVLAFKIGGIIKEIFVREGDKVRSGQLLATLDLTEINAQVAQAKFSEEKAQRDFDRITNLYKDSVTTLEQLQNVETFFAVAKEQLKTALFNKTFAEIHAPENGFVLRKFVNPGQVVSIGDPILLTNGATKGKWILKVGVSDKQWAALKIGDEAEVSIDAFPNRKFQGRVSRKAATSDAVTGAFSIEIQVRSEDVKLATGMFGSAQIKAGEMQPSWSVPYEAVLDANDDEGFVFITNDNKTAMKRPIKIGSFDGNSIRIVSGLEQAQTLIVSGSAYLADHAPINIIK